MVSPRRFAAALLFAGLLLVGCKPRQAACDTDFKQHMPAGWTFVSQAALDTDGNGQLECVVLYRFDTQTQEGRKIAPVNGVVYRADRGMPRWIYPVPLALPGNFYLGEFQVKPRMADVLSGSQGPELVLEDTNQAGIISEASLFSWRDTGSDPNAPPDLGQMAYKAVGSFVGDGGVKIDKDQVTVLMRRRDTRSQLADRRIYKPRDNKNYYQSNSPTLVDPAENDITSLTEMDNPTASLYPEKTVLAFYQKINDDAQVSKLMSQVAFDALQGGRLAYGCAANRGQLDKALVQEIDWNHGTEAQPLILVGGKCKLKDGSMQDMKPTLWMLGKVDNKWQLQASGQ